MFAKIFEQIYDSSIADDWQARVVFQDFLILADKDGVVDMTIEAIARRTNIPIQIIREAIPKLEGPDATSRTPDHDGRRIMRLDEHRAWGWKIVNFLKYRESATKEMLRMAEADRKREYRRRHGGKSSSPTPPTPTESEAEGEADMSKDMSRTSPPEIKSKGGNTRPLQHLTDWQLREDLKAAQKEIEAEKNRSNPDQGILNYHRGQREAIKQEQRIRGQASPQVTAKDEHQVSERNRGYNALTLDTPIVLDAVTAKRKSREAEEAANRKPAPVTKPVPERKSPEEVAAIIRESKAQFEAEIGEPV